MAGKTAKRSILDDLGSGAVLIQKGSEPAGDGQSMAGRASGESGSDSGSGNASAGDDRGDPGHGNERDDLLAGLVEFDPADLVGSEPAPVNVGAVHGNGNAPPTGSPGANGDFWDRTGNDASAADRRSDPATSRKRNETRAKNAKVHSAVDLTQTLLISIHNMMASALKSDVWRISEDEAAKLAEAAARVQAEYNLQLTPKQAAWANLGMVAGSVYGSRLLVHNGLKKMKAEAAKMKAQPEAAPVTVADDPVPGKPWRDGFGMVPGAGAVNPSQLLPPGMRGASL